MEKEIIDCIYNHWSGLDGRETCNAGFLNCKEKDCPMYNPEKKITTTTLSQMTAAGEIYRKRRCQKCGTEFLQKMILHTDENNAFEPAPLGTVIVNFIDFPAPFGKHRFEMLLCQNCAMKILDFLDDFKKSAVKDWSN